MIYVLVLCLMLSISTMNHPLMIEQEVDSISKEDNHLVIELFECKFLKDTLDYKVLVWYAAYVSGIKILSIDTCLKSHEWKYCVHMDGSSMTIYMWPKLGHVLIDICSSNESMDTNKTLVLLLNLFQPKSMHPVSLLVVKKEVNG